MIAVLPSVPTDVEKLPSTGIVWWHKLFQEIQKTYTNAVYKNPFSCTHSQQNNGHHRSEIFRTMEEGVEQRGDLGAKVRGAEVDGRGSLVAEVRDEEVDGRGQGYVLTVAQGEAVEKVRSVLCEGRKKEMLLWAVTGAGKTEMLFPLLADALARGWRVAVATPRRDVVLELVPRVRQAFPRERVVGLHGESRETWDAADIVVATTHQLLRFRAAFDLLVVDELDAFPYAGDRMLTRAARRAVAPGGRRLYLTATPSRLLLLHARVGDIGLARVPVRYHGQPLPVPTLARYRAAAFVRAVLASLLRGAQVFVFVPRIACVAEVVALLEAELANEFRIVGTSSKDADRAEHVLAFRAQDVDVIVTTTILERGVTVRKVDVHVFEADARVFTATSLIQMAGRAGRSAEDAYATVVFWAEERSLAMYRARHTIVATNRLARRRGYLKGGA
jgi:competence protein ComFA